MNEIGCPGNNDFGYFVSNLLVVWDCILAGLLSTGKMMPSRLDPGLVPFRALLPRRGVPFTDKEAHIAEGAGPGRIRARPLKGPGQWRRQPQRSVRWAQRTRAVLRRTGRSVRSVQGI
jgi:hypothetical protein